MLRSDYNNYYNNAFMCLHVSLSDRHLLVFLHGVTFTLELLCVQCVLTVSVNEGVGDRSLVRWKADCFSNMNTSPGSC